MQANQILKDYNLSEKSCVVLADKSSNYGMHIKEILRACSWGVALDTENPEEAFMAMEASAATVLVVDGLKNYPLDFLIRYLSAYTFSVNTPVLLFASNQSRISRTNNAQSFFSWTKKPLTPAPFLQNLASLVEMSGAGPDQLLKDIQRSVPVDSDKFKLALTKLARYPRLSLKCAILTAHHEIANRRYKEAEEALSFALKKNPSHLGLFFTLSYLYLESWQIQKCIQLNEKLASVYGMNAGFLADLIQAHICCNQYEKLPSYLKDLHGPVEPYPFIQSIMRKVLYSEGQISSLKKLSDSARFIKDNDDAWESLPSSLDKAS